jgi:hypothetical protein
MTGLCREAERAAMYNAALTGARPPQMVRLPRIWPLSRFSGATPASVAIFLRFRRPSSGSSVNKVMDKIRPTPGVLRRISSVSRHSAFSWIWVRSSSSNSSNSLSSHCTCDRMRSRTPLHACWQRFFSAASISTICHRRWGHRGHPFQGGRHHLECRGCPPGERVHGSGAECARLAQGRP